MYRSEIRVSVSTPYKVILPPADVIRRDHTDTHILEVRQNLVIDDILLGLECCRPHTLLHVIQIILHYLSKLDAGLLIDTGNEIMLKL